MKKCLFIFFFIVPACAAEPSWLFTEPSTPEHLTGAPGKGRLKICKIDDAPDKKSMRVPAGTYFADMGPIEPLPIGPQMWRLTVVTTNSTLFRPGQNCAVVSARVVALNPSPFKSVMRFDRVDKRHFEILAPDFIARKPDLSPWNTDYPSLEATAESDFK